MKRRKTHEIQTISIVRMIDNGDRLASSNRTSKKYDR